jgi:hypothetical protein
MMSQVVTRYRYRNPSKEKATNFIFSSQINFLQHESSLESVHLGVGAVMPHDLSSVMLGEMAEMFSYY